MNDVIKEKLDKLPQKPGVYMMKDAGGKIIYVGKAKILRNRVRQYFQSSARHSAKTAIMVSKVCDLDYIICDSEMEALVLESNLIKENKPRYNILLKDDKHYPYIKITLNEEYPRMLFVRKIENDGAKYFGPYPSGYSIKETMELLKNIFLLPHCKKQFPRDLKKDRPCLYYAMGRCSGVCQGNVSQADYRRIYKNIVSFLEGRDEEVIENLEKEMMEASAAMEFERAAILRDRAASVKRLGEEQKVITDSGGDIDVIAIAAEDDLASAEVFYIRAGKLIGKDSFDLSDAINHDCRQLLSEFVLSFYSRDNFIPQTVLLSHYIDELEATEAFLTEKRGKRAYIKVPSRGGNKKTVDMAYNNALKNIENYKTKAVREKLRSQSVTELAKALGLEVIPDRIESYDISHISGSDSVASMVVFENGKSARSEYRRFKIKTVVGADDTASLREVLSRRFTHEAREGDGKFEKLPDLILLDGGKGQLNAIKSLFEEMNIDIPVFGMLKDDKHRTRALLGDEGEVYLNPTSSVFHMVTNIQDEVHRFAIEYHRSLHRKNAIESELEKIEGIGKQKRIALLKHFRSIAKIKTASVNDLIAVKGISLKNAEDIRAYFNEKKRAASPILHSDSVQT
ncbi:MAG: excinuclease ABC subunit UvrC [Clostridia bacterium]|nr:excinuclease ABC subunit UvrC [Clostridia bacterium]